MQFIYIKNSTPKQETMLRELLSKLSKTYIVFTMYIYVNVTFTVT